MYRHRRRHFIRQLVYRPTVKQQYNSRIRQTDKTGKNATKLAALSRRALTALVASLLSFSVTRIITACDSNPSFLAFLWFSTGRDLYRSRTRRTVFRRRFWRSRLLGTPGRRSLLRWRTGLGRRCRFRRLRWRRGLWSWLGRCWGLLFWFQFRFLCVSLRYAQETRLSLNGVLMKLVNENLTNNKLKQSRWLYVRAHVLHRHTNNGFWPVGPIRSIGRAEIGKLAFWYRNPTLWPALASSDWWCHQHNRQTVVT